MTWAPDTWDAFAALLEEAWPGDFDDSTSQAWRVLLDPVPPEQATTALRKLLLEGRRFRPSVSELLAAVRDDPSRPTFEEAYRLIFGSRGALHARPRQGIYKDDGERLRLEHEAILERAGTFHPLIASFMQRQGIERLRTLPVDDPDWGEKRRADLQDAWDRHVEAFDGREVAAIASGRPDELHQLDPLAALGIPAPAGELEAGPTP